MGVLKFLLLVLFPALLLAAQYDITRVEVDPLGFIKVNFDGMDSSGTHNLGWTGTDTLHSDTSGIIGFMGVKRAGYDETGTRTDMYDTLLITTQISRNYPLNDYDSCDVYGTDSTTFTFATNKTIYMEDTVKWVGIAAGIYTQGSASNAYEAFTAINNSAEGYDSIKVIGGQSYPVGQRLVVDTNFRFSVTAIQESARNRKMVQCVKLYAEDEHSNTWDTLITDASIYDQDSLKVIEYAGNINLSGMTKNDTITVNWKIYPVYGDSLWSGDGVNTDNLTPYYSPKKFFYSERTALIVDAATGNDAANESVALDDFNPASPPAAFATIGGAINYCRTLAGEADLRGRYKLFARYGNYSLYGNTITAGTFSSMVIEIANFPGETYSLNAISGSTEFRANSWVKFKGCTLTTASGNIMSGEDGIILDSVIDNRSGGTLCYNTRLYYGYNVKHINDDFDMPYGAGVVDAAPIIRGCEFNTTVNSRIVPHMFIGNKVSGSFVFSDSLLANPVPQGMFLGFNYITTSSDIAPDFFSDTDLHHGLAIVQNIIEKTTTGEPVMIIAGDQSTSKSVNNCIFVNNTVTGERMNGPYNDYNLNGVTDICWRKNWTFKNNIFHRFSRGVTSFDAHGGTAGSPRHGNWMTIWGRNISGEIQCNRVSSYYPRFFGINSWNASETYDAIGTINNFIKFVDDNSYCGGGAGNGDYHLAAESPAINFSKDQVLPFDLDGSERGADSGAIGAYIYGTEAITAQLDSIHPDSVVPGDLIQIYLQHSLTGIDSLKMGDSTITSPELTDTTIEFICPALAAGWYLDTTIINYEGGSDTLLDDSIYVGEPPEPSITAQPENTVDSIGQDTALYVTADYADSYQWQRKLKTGGDSTDISGEIYDSLHFTDLSFDDTLYYYRARAINEVGEDTSSWVSIEALWLEPVIGGIVVKAPLRDSTKVPCARAADTVLFVGTIGDYADSAYVNSSGTVAVPILKTEHGAADTAYFVVPDIGVTGMWGFRTRLIFDHGGVRIVSDSPTADNKLYIKGF